jgi:hypothetical protein
VRKERKEKESGGKGKGGKTYALEVHGLHGFVHALYDARHVTRHLSHRHGRLDSARYGVDAAREAEEVQRLALLPDRIRGVYSRAVVIALLERLRMGA